MIEPPENIDDTVLIDCQESATEAARIADGNYVPTIKEAMRHPDAFVAGMTETIEVIPGGPVLNTACPPRSACTDCGADIYGETFDGRCYECRHRGRD